MNVEKYGYNIVPSSFAAYRGWLSLSVATDNHSNRYNNVYHCSFIKQFIIQL